VNITPTLPIPLSDIGRARELVEVVQPVERVREPASEHERVARRPSPQSALDVLEREALLDAYSQAHGQLQEDKLAPRSQRAVSAYNEVSLVQKRDLLTEVLGVDEFA